MKFKQVLKIIEKSILKYEHPDIYKTYYFKMEKISRDFCRRINIAELKNERGIELFSNGSDYDKFLSKEKFDRFIRISARDPNYELEKQKIRDCFSEILQSLEKFADENATIEALMAGAKKKTGIWVALGGSGFLTSLIGVLQNISGFMSDAVTGAWDNPWFIVSIVFVALFIIIELGVIIYGYVTKNMIYADKGLRQLKKKYNKSNTIKSKFSKEEYVKKITETYKEKKEKKEKIERTFEVIENISAILSAIGAISAILLCVAWHFLDCKVNLNGVSGKLWLSMVIIVGISCLFGLIQLIRSVIDYDAIWFFGILFSLMLVFFILVVSVPFGLGKITKVKGFQVDGVSYKIQDDGTLAICDSETFVWGNKHLLGAKSFDTLVIPEEIEGRQVTAILDNAFESIYFKNIQIPNSVTTISISAFKGCKIEEASIPAFACKYIRNSELSSVTITGGTTIESSVFSDLHSLRSVIISEGVVKIEEKAFYRCGGFNSLSIPNTIESIGDYAFYGTSIPIVTIKDGVKYLGSHVFGGSGICKIIVPKSVMHIGFITKHDGIILFYKGKPEEWEKNINTTYNGSIYYFSAVKPSESEMAMNKYYHYKNGRPVIW